ncbi:TPA: hypothetical protein U2K26_003431 [Legionella pneumophila]|uniref:HTH cro/C1-type domain-containing protein n=1 Tax=Legionella santicrucis TaxID=45074 RepID=A0A0W0YIA5_9GAMM|nr:hypothetical protein [Legionella pneumophila]KTD56624.1 hypothetical protein Lsan_2784 [Legionella santicrucis]CZP96131.1 Uncharacterised protein [Legionella pneumophila]HEM7072888.1 hypothetical protein [Legionella pneumophila]HEM7074476.1 hypothetical protein [Legionella pneumophila]
MKCQCKFKVTIYKGIIDYLLSSTHFTLKDIANHTGAPISSIRSIYHDQTIPPHFLSEIALTRLYQIILDIQMNKNKLHSDSE